MRTSLRAVSRCVQRLQRRGRTRPQRAVVHVIGFIGVFGCACGVGCSGAGEASSARRPTVTTTAVESVNQQGPSPAALAFFDALETRSFVAHDDVLEASLLLGTGKGAASSAERIVLAEALGYVDNGWARPPREASTIGEVSVIMLRVLKAGQARLSTEQATAELITLGILPPPSRSYQGLTGAQLVSILGGVNDSMRRAGVKRTMQPPLDARMLPKPDLGAPSELEPLPPPASGVSTRPGQSTPTNRSMWMSERPVEQPISQPTSSDVGKLPSVERPAPVVLLPK